MSNQNKMSHLKIIFSASFLILFIIGPLYGRQSMDWFLPIHTEDRQSWETVRLTSIGQFGKTREARPGIPAHLHTGVDLMRPTDNYYNEFIYPTTFGKVISLRDDGPFAQIIVEHTSDSQTIAWSVYEHISGINVSVGDQVNPYDPIARFMNKNELEKYGWQFDHLHFEILKKAPRSLSISEKTPFRFYGTYCLECFDEQDLEIHYYNPEAYLKSQWYNKLK